MSTLHDLALANDIKKLKELNPTAEQLNEKDERGYTPIHYLAKNGSYLALNKFLAQEDVDLNIQAIGGSTPLHLAAQYGHKRVVVLLLKMGANVNAQKYNGITALHLSILHEQTEVTKILLDAGADVHAQWGSAKDPISGEKIPDTEETVVNGNDETPLHLAAGKGAVIEALWLLEKKAKIEARTKNHFTPLHIAAEKDEAGIIELFCERGANIHAKGWHGMTPLHVAAEQGASLAARTLIKHGADPETCDKYRLRPMQHARLHGHIELAKYLCEPVENTVIIVEPQTTITPKNVSINRFTFKVEPQKTPESVLKQAFKSFTEALQGPESPFKKRRKIEGPAEEEVVYKPTTPTP